MTDRGLDHLHPDLKPLCQRWIDTCRRQSIDVLVIETYRSEADQDAAYAIGRTKPGKIITNARAGQSKHNVTLNGRPASKAFDFTIRNSDGTLNWNWHGTLWQTAVTIGKSIGLKWGGDFSFRDADHFELP